MRLTNTLRTASEKCILLERRYSAHNYTPMPVVYERALGTKVWDVDGKEYLDFGSSYGATNQGHSHPKITQALIDQAQKCALPSRAFTHNLFGDYMEFVCKFFGFEKAIPLNGGSEAVEFAIKLSRAWGYKKKGIMPDKAIVLFAAENYHGRTLGVTSASTNPGARINYGPFIPNLGPYYGTEGKYIRFNNLEDIEEAFETEGPNIASIILESIQGEAGVHIPDDGYLSKVKQLCQKHNILWIADEIQVGAGKTGKLLACDHDGVRPDVLICAKSIGGGLYPTSLVLTSKDIMDSIAPNSHGATFSGSPLSCATSKAALTVLIEENMIENGAEVGKVMIEGLKSLQKTSDLITAVRGRGMIAAIDIDETKLNGKSTWHICMLLKSKGLLAKMVHHQTIRFSPPLIMTKDEMIRGLQIISESLEQVSEISVQDIPGASTYNFLCH